MIIETEEFVMNLLWECAVTHQEETNYPAQPSLMTNVFSEEQIR